MLGNKIIDANRKVVEKIIVIGACIVLIGIYCLYRYKASLLMRDGVFVIGKVIDVQNVENGYNATISYRFNKKKFTFVQKTFPAIKDEFVFLMISKEKPKICSLIKDSTVPSCLITGRYFDSSWKSIPNCR